ncbi:hypothetical protein [Pseudorhodobacter sp.]|nr:hypothetical protein [Pseudorhodobacter sp.]
MKLFPLALEPFYTGGRESQGQAIHRLLQGCNVGRLACHFALG